MKNTISFQTQTCNGKPEVIKVVNGRADEIVKEFNSLHDATKLADILNARMKSIGDFKEFAQNEMKMDEYSFEMTEEGFGILRKDGTPRIGALLAMAKTFSEVTHNFQWRIFRNIGVEIVCYY